MAKASEVLAMLIPSGGYVQYGETFDGIEFIECKPITKKQYEDGFAKYDAWKTKEDADKASAKAAAQSKLAALGLTVEDLTALGL
jgi:hypothetical protein